MRPAVVAIAALLAAACVPEQQAYYGPPTVGYPPYAGYPASPAYDGFYYAGQGSAWDRCRSRYSERYCRAQFRNDDDRDRRYRRDRDRDRDDDRGRERRRETERRGEAERARQAAAREEQGRREAAAREQARQQQRPYDSGAYDRRGSANNPITDAERDAIRRAQGQGE